MEYILVFLTIPIIAAVDWVLFRKYLKCERCGYVEERWYAFLVPTFIEITLFLIGILIGSKNELTIKLTDYSLNEPNQTLTFLPYTIFIVILLGVLTLVYAYWKKILR